MAKHTDEQGNQEAQTGVQYVVHPTPPDKQGHRQWCAQPVTRKTYSQEELAAYVAARSPLLNAATVMFVQQEVHEAVKEILRQGDSVAFQNLFTMQLSISGTFEEGGAPDPAKGNVLKPRVRIAPAFIKDLNQGIAFVPKEETP